MKRKGYIHSNSQILNVKILVTTVGGTAAHISARKIGFDKVIPIAEIRVVDPFNFEECCIEALKNLEKVKALGDVYVNVTGSAELVEILEALNGKVKRYRLTFLGKLCKARSSR